MFAAIAGLQPSKFFPLRSVSDDQQMKFVRTLLLQKLERAKQCLRVLFPRQPANVKQQLLISGNA
ncbi:MAG: hypothetical protein DME54_11085 [Verrucomicrobia bacterium]|nr:MAG: hypothetical protein DME54_11085 [Verrucomicrobiota bacterium]PYL83185.1 MAG: hypothetical protein DMF21_00125 [Verrucomicrobiota bacterium]